MTRTARMTTGVAWRLETDGLLQGTPPQLVWKNLLGPQKNLTKLGAVGLKVSTLKAAWSTRIS